MKGYNSERKSREIEKFINIPKLPIYATLVKCLNTGKKQGNRKMIPIALRLKKILHREIAKAQDIIVETLYEVFNDAVFHGGTCIWRCYKGNRFSEDVDFYISKDIKKIDMFYNSLKNKGFLIEKKKIGENSIYSSLKLNRTIVRFEALFKKIKGSLKEYEKAEGNFINIYALTPEEIVKEKVEAYLKRFKIRDIYDIFSLLKYISNIADVKKELKKLLDNFKKPIDENELKVLIIDGLVPKTEDMLEYIRRKI